MVDIFYTVILTDTFWALVCLFIFFIFLTFLKVPSRLVELLDLRARRISSEVEEARNLHEEAQKLFVEHQQQYAEAKNKADAIIEKAKQDAAFLIAESKIQVQHYIAHLNKVAEQKITQAENDALDHVRSYLVDKVIAAATIILEKDVKIKTDEFSESSLYEIEKVLCKENNRVSCGVEVE